jgi:hypothetical protein
VTMEKAKDSPMTLSGAEGGAVGGAGLLLDWDFEKMGIGGLDDEFNAIFRRAFASRIYPPAVIAKVGVADRFVAISLTSARVRSSALRMCAVCCSTARLAPAKRSWLVKSAKCSTAANRCSSLAPKFSYTYSLSLLLSLLRAPHFRLPLFSEQVCWSIGGKYSKVVCSCRRRAEISWHG